jgi:outer membrane biosynthesis protein TonB
MSGVREIPGLEGTVVVHVVIGPGNQVLGSRIVKGVGYRYDEAMLGAILKSIPVFDPGKVRGQPVVISKPLSLYAPCNIEKLESSAPVFYGFRSGW